MTNSTRPAQPASQPADLGSVFAMSLDAFALIACEFMPASLLTPIAADRHVSERMAGQGIPIYGVVAVVSAR